MNGKERLKLIRQAAETARRFSLKQTRYVASPSLDTKPRCKGWRGFDYNPVLTSENTAKPGWMDDADEKPKTTVKHKRRHNLHPLTVIAHKLPMKLPKLDQFSIEGET